ncbi:MAG: integrase core domain-containing protein [Acidobacteria bacterium]|nr:integrase core domain-containing protein [Acidobacteriota bacterium]
MARRAGYDSGRESGRCLDNVFIERLWRSLKYEAVYLHELADGFAAERVIAAWMTFYSHVRPHLEDVRRPKPTARSVRREHPNGTAGVDHGGSRPPRGGGRGAGLLQKRTLHERSGHRRIPAARCSV